MKLRTKMQLLIAFFALALFIMGGISLFEVAKLGALQDEGYRRTTDGLHAKDAAATGAELYRVVADTIINRNLAESAKDWTEAKAAAQQHLKRLAEMGDTPEEKEAAAAAMKGFEGLVTLYERELLPLLHKSSPDWEAIRALDDRMDAQVDVINMNAAKVAKSMEKESGEADESFDATRKRIFAFTLAASLLLIVVAAAVGLSIMRNILRQLGGEPVYAAEVVNAIAAGDLTVHVETDPHNPDSLLASMQKMSYSLNTMVRQITDMSHGLVAAAEQVATASQQVSGSSASQSDAAASMSAAVEEMTTSVAVVAESSQNGEQLARQAGDLAQESFTTIKQVVGEIQQVATDVEESSNSISALREQSNQIHAVVSVIKEVADQTNLLALNAAIEAARAGEQGRGFAVVADEVRKLAERTSQSTGEIASIIESIRSGVSQATDSISHSNQSMTEGVRLAGTARESMESISSFTNDVLSSAQDISNALREQSSTSHSIAQSVEQIAQMAEENSIATREIAESAERLDQMAHQLKELVGRFRV